MTRNAARWLAMSMLLAILLGWNPQLSQGDNRSVDRSLPPSFVESFPQPALPDLHLSTTGTSRPGSDAQASPAQWVHTTQADWMAGERDHLDVRTLDALGLLYAFDHDPRGEMRLRSRPGQWEKHPDSPVLQPGQAGSWDDAVISEAKVIYDGSTFHMFYAGRRRGPEGLKMPMDIGYAVSEDGVHWAKSEANPVLVPGPAGSYDENMITASYALYDGGEFHLWFSAVDFRGDWSINYATSTDGERWEKDDANPLLTETHDGRWDAVYLAEPCVVFNGSSFEMWYNGASTSTETVLGHASSPDGIHWTRAEENRPVLDVGVGGAWDDFAVARAHVLYDGEQYKMWYEGHDGKTWRIGYALSGDGVHWERSPDSPILDLGSEDAWDSRVVSEPYVLFDGQTYRLWHSGYDGDRYQVGLATAPAAYEPRGSFLSPPIEAPQAIQWGTLTCDLDLPDQTDVQFEVSTSADGQTWSPWTVVARDWVSGVNQVALSALGLPQSRFFRYRATLTTSNSAVSPVIREVVVSEETPAFELTTPVDALSLESGNSIEVPLSIEPSYGFSAPIEWSVDALPTGLSVSWGSGAASSFDSAAMFLRADPAIEPRTALITVTARSADLAQVVTLSVTIVEPPPTATSIPTPVPATETPVATATPTVVALPPSPTPTNRASQQVATLTPTAAPSPLPPSQPPPLSPASPQIFWLGLGLAGGGVLSAVAWLLLLAFTRRELLDYRRRPWWRHWIWPLLLLLVALLGLFQSWRYVTSRQRDWEAYQSRIHPGVQVEAQVEPPPTEPSATPAQPGQLYVGGIDISGMTPDQARRAIEAQAIAPYLRTITVHCSDQTRQLYTGDLGFQTNLEQLITEALAVGTGQDSREAFGQFLLRNPDPVDVQLPLTYTFAYELLTPWVHALAREIDSPVMEHAFDPNTLTFTRGQAGIHLQVEDAVDRLRASVPDPSIDEVTLPVSYTEPHDWSDDEIRQMLARAAPQWTEAPVPASSAQITIAFDAERWIGPTTPAVDWQPTRPMTSYAFHPGRIGWTLDVTAAHQAIRSALDTGQPSTVARVFTDVMPARLALTQVEPLLIEIAGHFDGFTGFYVQDLATGEEIRHHTYVTTSGMSMIKVAIMATAYRAITRPFDAVLQDAMSQMIAHSINEKSNYVILQIGEGDFQKGLERVNETLEALGMRQTYIRSAYRTEKGPYYEPIAVPERPAPEVPPDDRVDLWPDTAMQTSLSDQTRLFEALYRGTQGSGRLLEAFPNLTPQDCQEMLDLLKTNPTRTFLGPGFSDDVPMAHKNGFGGGQYTDERMNVGIIWPPDGRPYLVGLYQWDNQDWIHWLRVWPQQIEFSTALYNYFTMPLPDPAPPKRE